MLRTRIAFAYSIRLGIVTSLLAIATFVATIMLGWHYAIDGVGGAAVALGSWWGAGKVMAWWFERQERWRLYERLTS